MTNYPSMDKEIFLPAEQFFEQTKPTGLTFDDISLATRYSDVLPSDANLGTRLSENISLNLPILSSDMDTVTESEMAIAMALCGGLGILHYNMSKRQQLKEVTRVKYHVHGLIQDPITITADKLIGDVLGLIDQKGFQFRTFPIVEGNGKLLGLLPGRVVKHRYRSRKVTDGMLARNEVYTVKQTDIGEDPIQTADRFFSEHMGIHKLLVVDDSDKLCGLYTLSDIERIIGVHLRILTWEGLQADHPTTVRMQLITHHLIKTKPKHFWQALALRIRMETVS